jgi:TolA-binding protein
MKHISAIFTALVITTIIGLGVAVIGVSAIANTNTVPIQSSRNTSSTGNGIVSTSDQVDGTSGSDSPQEKQLQQQVSDLQSQLSQASQVVQQYQSLLLALQQRGIIQIDRNGNIYVPQSNSFNDQ